MRLEPTPVSGLSDDRIADAARDGDERGLVARQAERHVGHARGAEAVAGKELVGRGRQRERRRMRKPALGGQRRDRPVQEAVGAKRAEQGIEAANSIEAIEPRQEPAQVGDTEIICFKDSGYAAASGA